MNTFTNLILKGIKMENVILPVKELNEINKLFPGIWKEVDAARFENEKKIKLWPDWCFLPVESWHGIVRNAFLQRAKNADMSSLDYTKFSAISDLIYGQTCSFAAIGAWRYTQGIYRFNLEFAKELCATELKGYIPATVLLRLPEWCIYVETPDLILNGVSISGFWAHLDSDTKSNPSIRLMINVYEKTVPFLIPLGPWALEDAIRIGCDAFSRNYMSADKVSLIGVTVNAKEMSLALSPLLSMVLYLCSDEPEISDRQPGSTFRRPQAKKTKKGWRIFPPEKPSIYQVGRNIGMILQKARAIGNHQACGQKSPRAHLRRAHWHGYWLGAGEDKRFSYKWLFPMIINGRSDEVNKQELSQAA